MIAADLGAFRKVQIVGGVMQYMVAPPHNLLLPSGPVAEERPDPEVSHILDFPDPAVFKTVAYPTFTVSEERIAALFARLGLQWPSERIVPVADPDLLATA